MDRLHSLSIDIVVGAVVAGAVVVVAGAGADIVVDFVKNFVCVGLLLPF